MFNVSLLHVKRDTRHKTYSGHFLSADRLALVLHNPATPCSEMHVVLLYRETDYEA